MDLVQLSVVSSEGMLSAGYRFLLGARLRMTPYLMGLPLSVVLLIACVMYYCYYY